MGLEQSLHSLGRLRNQAPSIFSSTWRSLTNPHARWAYLLDHSLLMQTSEAGQVTHHTGCVHYPVIATAQGLFQ